MPEVAYRKFNAEVKYLAVPTTVRSPYAVCYGIHT